MTLSLLVEFALVVFDPLEELREVALAEPAAAALLHLVAAGAVVHAPDTLDDLDEDGGTIACMMG